MEIYLVCVFLGVSQAVAPSGRVRDAIATGNPQIQLKATLIGTVIHGPKYALGESPSNTGESPAPSNTGESPTPSASSSMTADQIRDAKLFPDHRVSRIDVSSLVDVPATDPQQRNRPDNSPVPYPSTVARPFAGVTSGVSPKFSGQKEAPVNGFFRFNGNGQNRNFKGASRASYVFDNSKSMSPLFSAFEVVMARMKNMAPTNHQRDTSFSFNQHSNISPQQPVFGFPSTEYPRTNRLVASPNQFRRPASAYPPYSSYLPFTPSSSGNTYQTELMVDLFPYTSGTLDHVTSRTTTPLTPVSRYTTRRQDFNNVITQSNIFSCQNSCTNYCFFGYETDGAGCSTCVCQKPVFSLCPTSSCPFICPSGYERNSLGCDTCTCRQHSLHGGMVNYWGDRVYNNGRFE